MTAAGPLATVVVEPFFLETAQGRRFAVLHRPAAAPWRGTVLCAPPFNEEMNRCRSMLTLQAQAFLRHGVGLLVLDLQGTGDSEGEYRDARWAGWLADLRAAHAWLGTRPGACVGLLGVRLGAMLAAELHRELGAAGLPLMLWQPVVDGKLHLTQFMRVRIAAQLDRPDLPKETTATMRAQLAAGQVLEIAGYEIHPELAGALDAARLSERSPAPGTRVLWLENAADDGAGLAPASQVVIERWRQAGCELQAQTYAGPAFWQVHERVLTPAIVECTGAWFAAAGSGA